jgi:hypothetical protein
MRVFYRIRQAHRALWATLSPLAAEQVAAQLSPPQAVLFARMQPSEQYHAWRVWQTIQTETPPAPSVLATACLLHDVGKCLAPLDLWERIWVVLGAHFLPRSVARWGQTELAQATWWQRAFVAAVQHPQWGADLAHAAGAPLATVWLILNHQQISPPSTVPSEWFIWLRRLQQADDDN